MGRMVMGGVGCSRRFISMLEGRQGGLGMGMAIMAMEISRI